MYDDDYIIFKERFEGDNQIVFGCLYDEIETRELKIIVSNNFFFLLFIEIKSFDVCLKDIINQSIVLLTRIC